LLCRSSPARAASPGSSTPARRPCALLLGGFLLCGFLRGSLLGCCFLRSPSAATIAPSRTHRSGRSSWFGGRFFSSQTSFFLFLLHIFFQRIAVSGALAVLVHFVVT